MSKLIIFSVFGNRKICFCGFFLLFNKFVALLRFFTHKSTDSEEIRRDFVQMKVKTPSGVMVFIAAFSM